MDKRDELIENLLELRELHKKHDEQIKELMRITLRFLPGSKAYNTEYTSTHRKQLINTIEAYLAEGDNHVKD